jgi:hypothetical protein
MSVAFLLLMTSTSFAQSWCSDVDRVVKLAPSGFQAILEDSDRDPFQRRVTQRLPGASTCWYEPESRAYWCSWNVPFSQTASQVRQLASAIGQCYRVQPDYETLSDGRTTTSRDDVFAVVVLPGSISIYINGVAGTIAMSVTATDALDDRARRLKDSSGTSTEASGQGSELAGPEHSDPYDRIPSSQPADQYVSQGRVYPPAESREMGGVRSPRDSSIVIPPWHLKR